MQIKHDQREYFLAELEDSHERPLQEPSTPQMVELTKLLKDRKNLNMLKKKYIKMHLKKQANQFLN